MARRRQPNYLDAITGAGSGPSTLEVLNLSWRGERMSKEYLRSVETMKACDASLAIIAEMQELLPAIEVETDPEKKRQYEVKFGELRQRYADSEKSKVPHEAFAQRVCAAWDHFIRVGVVHAFTVAISSLTLALLYGLLAFGALLLVGWLLL